jgi:nucleoside-diphosphate-sugar epimerase
MPFVGLRFSNILAPVDYEPVPTYWGNPHLRKWNLWGYVDVRDAAQACQRAVEADVHGAQSFIIAAADTIMTRPSADLLRDVFPGVRLTREVGECETLLAIDAARTSLGYAPEHSWREVVTAP